jgi:hypothetical protein
LRRLNLPWRELKSFFFIQVLCWDVNLAWAKLMYTEE